MEELVEVVLVIRTTKNPNNASQIVCQIREALRIKRSQA